ncbi:hypothetical protein ACFVP0_04565 [Streptomyces cinereoruber]
MPIRWGTTPRPSPSTRRDNAMSTNAPHPGRRELRVTVTDEVHGQLQR